MGKPNPQNLINLATLPEEERKVIIEKGHAARREKAAQRRSMSEWAKVFGGLKITVKDDAGKSVRTNYDGAVIMAQYRKAILRGDTKAAEFLAKLLGEYAENVNINTTDPGLLIQFGEKKDE